MVSFVPMDAVSENGGLRLDEEREIEDVYTGYTYFKDGDVVLAKITPCFENGKASIATGLTNQTGFGTTELHVLRPKNIDREYLFYLLCSDHFRKVGESTMYGAGGQKRLPESFIANYILPVTDRDHQRAIANYLDAHTARLDALITAKERLLKLLAERRAALITRAVTRGLDENVALKDSGVDWLGEIPMGWEVKKLGLAISKIITGGTPSSNGPSYFVDEGIDWFTPSDFSTELHLNSASRQLNPVVFDETGLKKVQGPAVLIVSIGATLGKIGYTLNLVSSNQQINILSPGNQVDARYLSYFLTSFTEIIKLYSNSSTLGIINQQTTKQLLFLHPPISVQKGIANYLDLSAATFKDATTKIHHSLHLLREYRAALITAAVNGEVKM